MDQAKGYSTTAYLQAAAARAAPLKQRSYALVYIEPGYSVLDVGCGPGTDALNLVALVGGTGTVTGVDYDPAMVGIANVRAAQDG